MAESGQAPGMSAVVVVGWPPFSDHLATGGNVKRPRILVLGALAAVTAVALLAAACGGGDSGSSTPAAGSGGSGGKVFKIGLVTDIGGLDDKSFNHLAFVGIQRAKSQLGIDFKVLESHQESEYVPNLQTAGRGPLRPRDRGRLPHGRRHQEGREGLPDNQLRDHRRRAHPGTGERPGAPVQGAGVGLSRRVSGGARVEDGHRLDRRRPEDPAGRPLHRGLPGGSQGRGPG